MIQPCPNPLNCLDAESPVANLTAEDPDQLKCFRFAFTASSSITCEFPITICNDFASVGGDVGVLCAPPPTIINRTNPPAPIIYSSNAQTCTVDCGDFTSETYTVVSGTFVALSQGEADLAARTFACQLAAMLCDGPLPPLFTSTAQTCVATCTNGSTVSYTTPAGFFSALSQAEADSNAFLFACEIAALLCNDLPPTGTLPGAGTARPPVEPLYASAAATCVVACSNGSLYSFTVGAGAFLAESPNAANAMASSYACRQAQLRRVCLSDLPNSLCVDEFESEFVEATGLAEPVSYAVSAGSLPPGMTLDSSGFFSGTPTTPGSYSFAITATGSDGQSTSRSYTISVAGIDQSVLTEAELDEEYSEQLNQTGMAGSVTWAVVDGFLPDGITLSTDGELSGTPTEDGDFPVTIAITNGTDTCSKDFVLTVVAAGTPQSYWTLQGPVAANDDEYTGDLLAYNNFGATITTVAGKVNNALSVQSGFATVQQQGPTLAYGGEGWSLAFWFQWDGTSGGLVYQWDTTGSGQFFNWDAGGTGAVQFAVQGVDLNANVGAISTGVWHFVVFTYTHAGALRYSLDGAALASLGTPPTAIVTTDPLSYALWGNENYLLDETASFPFPLTAAQIAYLWNGGTGRTWPITLP